MSKCNSVCRALLGKSRWGVYKEHLNILWEVWAIRKGFLEEIDEHNTEGEVGVGN